MPTSPRLSAPLFFSTISWTRRTRVRSISEADISCDFSRSPGGRGDIFAVINAASYAGDLFRSKVVIRGSSLNSSRMRRVRENNIRLPTQKVPDSTPSSGWQATQWCCAAPKSRRNLPRRYYAMHCASRYLSSLLLAAAFLSPALTTGCGGHSYRVYDPYHNDYHRWDNHETVYYHQWAVENHR